MAKIIEYQTMIEVNIGTEEKPNILQKYSPMAIRCKTKESFDANYPIAEMEAIEGSIEVTGEFDDVTLAPTQLDRVESQVAYLAMMTGYPEILEV